MACEPEEATAAATGASSAPVVVAGAAALVRVLGEQTVLVARGLPGASAVAPEAGGGARVVGLMTLGSS